MPKKMYSFRLDEDIINEAKKNANKLSISLSAYITLSLIDKIDSKGNGQVKLDLVADELKMIREIMQKVHQN